MATLVFDPASPEIEALRARRARAGLDRLDEVWEGVLHMIPAPDLEHARVAQQLAELLGPAARSAGLEPAMHEFNLGHSEHDFRVPDGGLLRPGANGVWLPTAPVVVEIVAPNDETWEKLPLYAAHEVEEVLIADPHGRSVHWLARSGDEYHEIKRSGLIDLGPGQVAERLGWSAQ